jgi:hypothetical protein
MVLVVVDPAIAVEGLVVRVVVVAESAVEGGEALGVDPELHPTSGSTSTATKQPRILAEVMREQANRRCRRRSTRPRL